MKKRLLLLTCLAAVLASTLLFATQIVTDDFNRADSTGLGANWTQGGDGRLDVVSNQAKIGVNNFSVGRYTGASWTGGNDQYGESKITALESGKDMGTGCRMSGTSNATVTGYIYVINEPDAAVSLGSSIATRIYKVVSGTFTPLGGSNVSTTISANDVIRTDCEGTTIRGKVNGTAIIAITSESSIASGSPGLYIGSGTTSTWDDFAAGDFGGAAAAPKLLPLLGVGLN